MRTRRAARVAIRPANPARDACVCSPISFCVLPQEWHASAGTCPILSLVERPQLRCLLVRVKRQDGAMSDLTQPPQTPGWPTWTWECCAPGLTLVWPRTSPGVSLNDTMPGCVSQNK